MTDARKASYEIIYKVLEEKQFSHVVIQNFFRTNPDMDRRDRAFTEHIVRNTIEHLYEIDARLNHVSKTPVRKMRPQIRTILRTAAAQICFSDNVPVSAVCNESVKLTAKLGFVKLKGFVNGVLRNTARELEAGFVPEDDSLSMRYSIPSWMAGLFAEQFTGEQIENMMKAMAEPSGLCIFRNKALVTSQELEGKLKQEGIECEPLPYALDGYRLIHTNRLEQSESFQNGDFLIQDVSSMIHGLVAGTGKDRTIIDVCAAPGGKSIHAAFNMENTGIVYSCDLTKKKTDLIRENVSRMKLLNVRVLEQDALIFNPEFSEKADVLIADLPCSGLGIMGRKPEIRFNITMEDILSLQKLQRQILDNVVRYVKPGGRIIYSTCTLTVQEDEDNFRYLLEKHHFTGESLVPYLPEGLSAPDAGKGYLKLIPGIHECDGFFIASARKPLKQE